MNSEGGDTQLGLSLVLPYLPVCERLALAAVSTYLRNAAIPWTHFIFDDPINLRVTDEILLKITARAQGKLKSLTLNHCFRITDGALQLVAQRNPFLRELRLPGCTSITGEGVLAAIKSLTLNSLHINGVFSLKRHHVDWIYEHMSLTSEREKWLPLFFNETISGRAIDVEVCPKCSEARIVYGCPRGYCENGKACKYCVVKCVECGVCVNHGCESSEKGVCFDDLCGDCWLILPKCVYCNRPYCRKHAHLGTATGSFGFACAECLWDGSATAD